MHICILCAPLPLELLISISHNPDLRLGASNAKADDVASAAIVEMTRAKRYMKPPLAVMGFVAPTILKSNDIQIDVFVYRHRFQFFLIEADIEDCLLLLGRKSASQV